MNLKLVLAFPLALLWLGGRRFRRDAQERRHRHRDIELDEALDESFPASDPPAMTSPSTAGEGARNRH